MFIKRFSVAIFLIAYSLQAFSSPADPKPESRALKFLTFFWGDPAQELTIIPDMYDYHILRADHTRTNNNPNPILAVSYKGFFAGTFDNSYSIRTYIVGIQRYVIQGHPTPNFALQLGYRLGLMFCYQHKHLFNGNNPLAWLNQNSPIFPAGQVIFDITYRHLGLELSWMNVVATGSIYIRF